MTRYSAIALPSSKDTTQLVDNLNEVENNFQIARNFDQPNRRAVKVIKTANEETGNDLKVN